ncbi:MAG: CPBP family glutamic-type intramembrane protease, partial [Acidobacteriota bacterium]
MQNIDQAQYYSNRPLPVEPSPVDLTPTPNDPPWGMFEAVGVWIASVLFIVFVPAFFLLPYLALHKPPITASEQIVEFAKNDPTAIFLQILAVLPAHLLTILLAWLVVTRARKFSFRETLGWQKGGFVWWHYAVILIAFFTIAGVVNSLAPEQENDLIRMLQSSRSVVYIVAFVATFTAPLVEEVVYRGVLYSAFQRVTGVPAAFVLV